MNSDGYWSRVTQGRVSRRRALAGAAGIGAGVAALSLVGCGGDGEESGGSANVMSDPNAIAYSWQRPDETKDAVPGGTYDSVVASDITGTLDPMISPSFTTVDYMGGTIYQILLRGNSGPGIDPRSDEGREIRGMLAEKFEVADDNVTYTFKLRPNVKFHNVAPVNGRVMDIDDWKTSFDRFVASSPFKANITETIDKYEFPDNRTMVMKLKEPSAAFLRLMTASRSTVLILPKELNADPELAATKPIGTSYRVQDKRQPSVTVEYKRHDDYWEGKPYIERWHYPIIPEYANRYAQFITGHILGMTPRQTDVIQMRKDVPKAVMLRGDPSTQYMMNFFGYKDLETAPWKDDRVRKALRMSVDWNAIAAYFSNKGEFEANNLPVEIRMPTHTRAGGSPYIYWLNPEKNELGDVSKFLLFNLAEAKKLMQAAGFNQPVEIEGWQHNGAQYGSTYQEQGDLSADAWNKSGLFNVKITRLPYPQFLDQCYQKRDFKGMALEQYEFVYSEVDFDLFNWYHSKGARFKWFKGDTKLDDLIIKQRSELDDKKRTAAIHDIQKYMADKMMTVPGQSVYGGFGFQWPALRNAPWPGNKEFIDKTRPPYAG